MRMCIKHQYSFKVTSLILSTLFTFILPNSKTYAHSIPLKAVAVKACENKIRSVSCEYEGAHNDLYIGTCQYMVASLICVRNQPIKKLEPVKVESTKSSP